MDYADLQVKLERRKRQIAALEEECREIEKVISNGTERDSIENSVSIGTPSGAVKEEIE